PRMTERAGDEQICLSFQSRSLDYAGWRISVRLDGRDIDGKAGLPKFSHKVISASLLRQSFDQSRGQRLDPRMLQDAKDRPHPDPFQC
ncbi:hypothetical protein ACC780_37715, partial [Rhizobium ruizarguesonis]